MRLRTESICLHKVEGSLIDGLSLLHFICSCSVHHDHRAGVRDTKPIANGLMGRLHRCSQQRLLRCRQMFGPILCLISANS